VKWSFNIGSIVGIPIKIHITFILLLGLIYIAGASLIGIDGIRGVIFVCLVFASVVFHELAHSMVALRYGIGVKDITLLPIGGVARITQAPKSPTQEIIIAAAGPASSLLLGFALLLMASLLQEPVVVDELSVGGNVLAQLCAVNFVLAVFNLIPAFPMDGGRIFRGALSLYMPPEKATRISVGLGRGLAVGLCLLGLWTGNLFVVAIGIFVYIGAGSEEKSHGLAGGLNRITAGSVMIQDVDSLSPAITLGATANLYFRSVQRDFPIVDKDRVVGLLTRDALQDALSRLGPDMPVSAAMIKDYPIASADAPIMEVLGIMDAFGVRAVPVVQRGKLAGLLTREQIDRIIGLFSGRS
jgi:Zn-dependent protease/CBS domain-containing protein